MNSRIEIKYEIEEGNSIKTKSLPFCVGIIGDLCGNNSDYSKIPIDDRDFIPINQDNFNQVLSQLKPRISFNIENRITNTDSIDIDISFTNIADFHPSHIIKSVPEIKKLYELRNKIKHLQIQSQYDNTAIDELKQILNEYQMNKESQHE